MKLVNKVSIKNIDSSLIVDELIKVFIERILYSLGDFF